MSYYQTDPPAHLSVTITTSTQDFQNFYPITFDLNISPKNSKSKIYKIDYINSSDMLQTILRVRSSGDPFVNKCNFSKRYNKDKNLEVKFEIDSNKEEVVTLTIRCSELDFNSIIIPKGVFYSICNLIKDFNVNYTRFSNDIINNFLQIESLKELKNNSNLLKSLPSKLIEFNFNDYVSKKTGDNKEISETVVKSNNSTEFSQLDSNSLLSSKNLDDFDKFIGGNEITNIEVTEVTQIKKDIPKDNTPQEVIVKFNSEFINKVLNNDILNFENLMYSVYQDPNPLQDILIKLKDNMNLTERFHFLSDIKEQDLKSIYYISNVMLKTNLKKNINQKILQKKIKNLLTIF